MPEPIAYCGTCDVLHYTPDECTASPIDDAVILRTQPTADAYTESLRHFVAAERTVDISVHRVNADHTIVWCAASPIPDDEGGSVEVAYGADAILAYVNLGLNLMHNDHQRAKASGTLRTWGADS